MSHATFHELTSKPASLIDVAIVEKSEHEKAVAEAYAKGRADVFAFLGLDEKDFPAGDGLTGWAV